MNAPLYTTAILRLAASLPEPRVLDRTDGSAEARSPTCGSRIRTEVQLDESGRIAALSQSVTACAFGQAAASLVAAEALGRDRAELAAMHSALGDWLDGKAEDAGPFAPLAPARSRRGRHGAILLPLKALLVALDGCRR